MSLTMSAETRQAFLAGLHVGIISIQRESRAPLTVPIWYDYEPGGTAWFTTGRSSLKGRALEQTDRISLCAQTETPPYQYVTIEGPFTIEPSTQEQLLAMAIRYLGEKRGRAYAEGGGGEDSILVRITPENWLSVDYNQLSG